MTHPDLHSLTGAYAADALDEEERRAFEAHLPDCESCRAEVEGFLATTAMLGAAAAEPPPAHLRASVLGEVSRTRQEPPAAAPERERAPVRLSRGPARRAWLDRLLLPAAAVMAVVLVGMAVLVGSLNERIDELEGGRDVTDVVAASDLQTWEAEMPDGGVARVVYSASRGEGWFVADGMDSLGEDRVYELWLIDDAGPSPAGLFDAHDGQAVHAFTGDVTDVAAIGVTVEPAGGSPQPTSDPLVVLELEPDQA